jgi:hypothetical protein
MGLAVMDKIARHLSTFGPMTRFYLFFGFD